MEVGEYTPSFANPKRFAGVLGVSDPNPVPTLESKFCLAVKSKPLLPSK